MKECRYNASKKEYSQCNEERNKKMRRIMVLLLLFLCIVHGAMAGKTWYIGGSRADVIESITADETHVVMAGYTFSSDGTLSDRTKTGRSGWITCLGQNGETLWNFCSRNSSNDEMHCPVIHSDGTITVLLYSGGHEKQQIELLRLNLEGKLQERILLLEQSTSEAEKAGEYFLSEMPESWQGGYTIVGFREQGKSTDTSWMKVYDFDGRLLYTVDGRECRNVKQAMGQKHAILLMDGQWTLCRMEQTPVRLKVLKEAKTSINHDADSEGWNGLCSLTDGCIACGWTGDQYRAANGKVTRWDTEGKLMWDKEYPDRTLWKIVPAANGYVISYEQMNGKTGLMVIDGRGQELGDLPCDITNHMTSWKDGIIRTEWSMKETMQGDEAANWDVQITVLNQEDLFLGK